MHANVLHATPTYVSAPLGPPQSKKSGQTPEGSTVAKCGSYYLECDCNADIVKSLNIALIYKKTCNLH